MKKFLPPHIRIEESPIHGRGVFANMFIPSGSYIGEYTGPEAKRNGKYVLHLDGKPAVRGTGPLRYLNHSVDPNAEFDGLHIYALRDIEVDEEITFDYGEDPSQR